MTRAPHQVADLRDLLAAPPADARPGIRWWWAAPLAAPEALRELRAVADAGFGEVEVAFSPDAWATPGQRSVLRAVLDEAAELGLTVSITMGASWPVNTPHTGEGSGHSARELQHGRVDLRDGSAWVGPAPAPFDADVHDQPRRLVAVSAARVLRDGDRAELLPAEQRPRWGTPVRALTCSTLLDPDSMVLLEGATAEHVTFAPPDRDHWVLVASWEREARGHHTDPFAAGAARAATAYLDEHQLGPEALPAVASSPGDFFEDSLELNATSVFWTPGLPERFAEHRGYDLLPLLPLLYAHGMANYWVPDREPTPDHDLPDGLGDAVRRDYLRTLTDLYVEDHLAAYQTWAETHGRTFKAQVAYGQDLEPVRSARALARLGGRVETESLNSGDRAPVRQDHPTWRFALDHQRSLVSGVHQTGRTRVSTELGAQFLATYELSLGDYREMMDKEWAVGVTRPYVHGLAHDPAGTPWPGKQRFGDYTAESWNPAHFPQWASWPVLTGYWARGTALLESGTARADVAFLRDGFLTSAARGFADPDLEGLSPARLVDGRPLEQEGYVVQLVDPVLLEEADPATDGELLPDAAAYRAVVVDQRSISPRVLERLLASTQGGLRVVLVGDLPTRSATLDPTATGSVPELVADLLARPGVAHVELASEVPGALRSLGMVPRVATRGTHLLVQVRDTVGGRLVLAHNPADVEVRATLAVDGLGVPTELDLWSGTTRACGRFDHAEGRTRFEVTVPARSCVLVVVDPASDPAVLHAVGTGPLDPPPLEVRLDDGHLVVRGEHEAAYALELSDGSRRRVVVRPPEREVASIGPHGWRLTVATAAAKGAARTVVVEHLPTLADWRSLGELAGEAGTGTYEGACEVPPTWVGDGFGVRLDLGRLAGTAEVLLNGVPVGHVVDGHRPLDVTHAVRAGTNTLTVVVRTVLRNAVTHHAGTSTRTAEIGLRGPVRFSPWAEVVVPAGTGDPAPHPASESSPRPTPEQQETP